MNEMSSSHPNATTVQAAPDREVSVREVFEVEPSDIKAFENNDIILYRGGALPLLRLGRVFQLGERYANTFHVFVVGSGTNLIGIAVDRILGQREIVVRAVSDPLIQVAGIAGATELGDGHIVLILDAAALTRSVRGSGGNSDRHQSMH